MTKLITEIFTQIEKYARSDPKRIALQTQKAKLSYENFHARITQSQSEMKKLGLGPGHKIGIYLENGIDAYCSIYACLSLGCTFVPLSLEDPATRLEEQTKILDGIWGLEKSFSWEKPWLSPKEDAENRTKDWTIENFSPNVPVYILYTSGSTGKPKAVCIFEHNLANFMQWASIYFSVSERDVFLAHPKLTFDLSLFSLLLPLMHGSKVIIAEDLSERMFPGSLLQKEVSITLFAPRITNSMKEAEQLPMAYPSLRHLLFCGEPLLASQVGLWREQNPSLQIYNLYGPTEATIACSIHKLPTGPVEDPIPIGKEIPGNILRIENNQTEGELILSGKQLGKYLQESDHFFIEGEKLQYRSGDFVKKWGDELLFVGRKDTQIKIRGQRIDLQEIAYTLKEISQAQEVACISHEDKIYAFLEADHFSFDKEILLKKLGQYLPAVMLPEDFYFLSKMPLNTNGKLDRIALKQLIKDR